MKSLPIQLNEELFYTPPPLPKDKSEILFYKFKKKDQHWRRPTDLPATFWGWNEDVIINAEETMWDGGSLISLSVDDTITEYTQREREMERRQKGIWFYNNGSPVYLTGDNYFFLVYCYMAGVGYPDYRKFQLLIHYVIAIADKDPNKLGAYFHKAKKTGLTQIIVSLFLNRSTMMAERGFGFMNKSKPEANDLNMVYFDAAYEKLPAIMAPKITKKSEERIIFGKPAVKYTGTIKSIANIAKSKLVKALNTWIFTAATVVEPKFDGPKMYYIQLDELPKYKISVKKLLKKLSETVKLQTTIIGKIWITSYPPEEDTDAFFESQEIYYDSKLSTIKEGLLGRTKSGLICYFVGALQSTDGTFDIYGEADEAEALRLNQAERDNCGDDKKALQSLVRQYPRTEEEGWQSGGAGSTFDNIHLAQAKNVIQKKERNGEQLFVDVNLSWTNGRFSKVTYTPITAAEKAANVKGWWRFYEIPDEKDLNLIYKDEDGYFTPTSDSKFVAGVDVTEYVNTKDIQGSPSNNCITVLSHPDVLRDSLMGRPASKLPVCVYFGRKEDPDDFIEDMILTMFLFSLFALIEANKRWVLTKLKTAKLQNFLLCRQMDGTITPFKIGENNMSTSSTTEVINLYCRLITTYLKIPRMPGEVDYCLAQKCIELIDQLMNFKPMKTTKYDRVVSLGYALIALESFAAWSEHVYSNKLSDDAMVAFADWLLNAV